MFCLYLKWDITHVATQLFKFIEETDMCSTVRTIRVMVSLMKWTEKDIDAGPFQIDKSDLNAYILN